MRRVSKLLDGVDKEAKQINGRQVIFQHELTDFSRIAELKKTFDPFSLLWPAVDQWVKIKQSIRDQPMIQLNAENITRDLQLCFQSLHKSTRNFRDGPQSQFQIATGFKNEVVEMRDHIPLLTCLLNPGMKQRHWTKLSHDLGFEFTLDEEITLGDALKLKLEDKIDIIQDVVSIASKEYSIETALQKMYNEWEEVLLEIEPYKNTGTFVLKGSDDIIQKLDDDMVMTNTMAFSPYK